MLVLVFGATGRTGRHIAALADGGVVKLHAVGRDPARLAALPGSPDWSVADVADADAIATLIRAVMPSAVVSIVGGRTDNGFIDETGNIAIARAAQASGLRRIIQVSSLGCGDSRSYASERLLAAIGTVLEAKTRAEDYLRGLDLDWTIIRPGGLTEADATGTGALYDDPRVHGRIACADLAGLILGCLAAPASVRKALSAVDRASLSGPSDPREFALDPYSVPTSHH